jgi:hypothetical protein
VDCDYVGKLTKCKNRKRRPIRFSRDLEEASAKKHLTKFLFLFALEGSVSKNSEMFIYKAYKNQNIEPRLGV